MLHLQGVQSLLACNLLQQGQKSYIQKHYAVMLQKYPPITTHWENLRINDNLSVKIGTNGEFLIFQRRDLSFTQ